MYILSVLNACTDSGILSVILFVKKMIEAVFFIVPVILIVMVIIDLVKNVIAAKEDNMNANRNRAIKRIIYCIVLFFVPTIVNLVMNMIYDLIDNTSKESAALCWKNANEDTIKKYRELEDKGEEYGATPEQIEQWKQEAANNKNPIYLGPPDEGDGSSSGSSGDTGVSTVGNYTIYVGDSRMEGMCAYVSGSNEICKAVVGVGLPFLKTLALDYIKEQLATHPDANVVINLGVNDLVSADNTKASSVVVQYREIYAKLIEDYPSMHLMIVSAGSVDDSKQNRVSNSVVNYFNLTMKSAISNLNARYCDVNSSVSYTYASDGIHYDSASYKKMYEAVKACL